MDNQHLSLVDGGAKALVELVDARHDVKKAYEESNLKEKALRLGEDAFVRGWEEATAVAERKAAAKEVREKMVLATAQRAAQAAAAPTCGEFWETADGHRHGCVLPYNHRISYHTSLTSRWTRYNKGTRCDFPHPDKGVGCILPPWHASDHQTADAALVWPAYPRDALILLCPSYRTLSYWAEYRCVLPWGKEHGRQHRSGEQRRWAVRSFRSGM